jgi:glycolate oxidase FAD binding subunit
VVQVARPASLEELAETMREAERAGAVVGVRGASTKATWGATGHEPDVVVDTTAMASVLEHAAGDLVVTVQAGARLDDVQQGLAGAGQWLALDPAEAGATVGGVVATAASGPRRLRFGTPRDLLIGVTVVLVDGTVARSGGKVVKNVAGYDLGKLFTGSYGTLGVVAEATWRLHPRPAAFRVVSIATDDPALPARELLRSTVVASAVEWDGSTLDVLLESTGPGADAQADAVVRCLGGGVVTDELPQRFGRRPWSPGQVAVKLTFRLSALGRVVAHVRELMPRADLAAHAGSGVLYAGWDAGPGDVAATLDELRRRLAADDGHVVVVDAPQAVKDAVDVWGPVPGLAVMRRIKERFDPDGRMNPGRFVGGL